MEDHERVKLLESYGTPYCSYIMGGCVLGYGPCTRSTRSPVACRNCRQANEREATQ